MKKKIVSACIIALLFAMCENQKDKNDAIGFSLLNGNNFLLKVDRVLNNNADVQFPGDNLLEDDYDRTNEYTQYDVTFSEDGQIVTMEPGSILGKKINDGKEAKRYEFVEGVFAGGRFIIWIDNENFEAEHTIYGSGVPIINSVRGKLDLVVK